MHVQRAQAASRRLGQEVAGVYRSSEGEPLRVVLPVMSLLLHITTIINVVTAHVHVIIVCQAVFEEMGIAAYLMQVRAEG